MYAFYYLESIPLKHALLVIFAIMQELCAQMQR